MSSQPLPLFPLGTVLLPGSPLPLRIFEPRYRQLVADLMERPADSRGFGVVAIREGREVGEDGVRAMYDVGCLAVVTDIHEAPDGTYDLATVGTTRFRVLELDHGRPYLSASVEWLQEPVGETGDLMPRVSQRYEDYRAVMGVLHGGSLPTPELPTDARMLSYLVAGTVMAGLGDRQAFLAEPTAAGRLALLSRWLRLETTLLRRLSAVPASGPLGTPASVN